MTIGDIVDFSSILAYYLYNYSGWPKVGVAADPIGVYAISLPSGWTLSKTVLIKPQGITDRGRDLFLREGAMFWCYATNEYDAYAIYQRIHNALMNYSASRAVTLSGQTATLGEVIKTSGPDAIREFGTNYPRVISTWVVEFSRYAV